MPQRLYLDDAYLREFTARVTAVRPDAEGGGTIVELDRTAFYPTAGGQLHDTGALDGRRVVEVVEDHDEVGILHRVAPGAPVSGTEPAGGAPAAEGAGADLAAWVGVEVRGRIDWARRFDHMQQHTGQHLLSQAALRELDAATLAVHLGAERCTVDLALTAFGPAEAERLEEAANAVVVANLPIRTHMVPESEIPRWGLRRPPKKSGTIRIVEIEGFDRSACGGTHVRTTSEIGTIALTGWQRYKGGTRLEFLCGGRAVRDHRFKTTTLSEVSRLLSAAPAEVEDAVTRLIARERESDRRSEMMTARSAAAEATIRRRTLMVPAVYRELMADRPGTEARALAEALTNEGGVVALLAAGGGQLIFARSADLSVDVSALLRRVFERFGGRGGGKAALAQGTLAEGADPAAALDAAARWAEEALGA